MTSRRFPDAVSTYVGLLAALYLSISVSAAATSAPGAEAFPWLVLVALFGLAEAVPLHFHHERGRQSLGAGEALVIPMVVALSFSQLVWSLGVIIGAIAIFYWRQGTTKTLFNVAQHGCAGAGAGLVWELLNTTSGGFSVRNAAAAFAAGVVFTTLNHVFVAVVLALSEQRAFLGVLRGVASAAQRSAIGNLSLGLLFAASYVAAPWSVVLFIFPLAGLYYGYRAILRQERERERVESLHAASRALAATHNLEDALSGFLKAMRRIVSAGEARAVLYVNRQWVVSTVRGGEVVQRMEAVAEGPLLSLAERFRTQAVPLVVSEDDAQKAAVAGLAVRSLVGVPLMNGDEYAGCLLAIDRLGAEEFGQSDARLLEALGNELVLTLDSYRLFAQVTEERERFQQIFAGSKEGICLLDERGAIRAWNPALARITGFEEPAVIGAKWSDKILVRDRYHRRIEGLDIVTVPPDEELELVTREGPPRWIAVMSGEVQSEDQKSWVVLVRDITAEHELEESKSDFLSTISHELRTPLTTIKGSLQVLSRPNASADSEIGSQMIAIMRRGSDRLERLVMNLLAVSQMESGELQVFPDEVRLEELVSSRIASVLPDHPQVAVEVGEEVVVRADRERLSQAIEHLLDNARKFGPESGRIEVEIAKENGFARLSVRDEGPGIPQIDQQRIFDRFVRLGHVLTRETQGPGVGLFIVKRSIEAMGGSISVDSEPNHGATFTLRIPLAHPMAAIETSA
jgi:PAS domain S-box-containing protein